MLNLLALLRRIFSVGEYKLWVVIKQWSGGEEREEDRSKGKPDKKKNDAIYKELTLSKNMREKKPQNYKHLLRTQN